MTNVHVPPVGGQSLASDERSEAPEASKAFACAELPPQFAVRSDAVVLLSTVDMEDRDLTGRTFWTGLVLTAEETAMMRRWTVDFEQEIAAKLIGKMPEKPARQG